MRVIRSIKGDLAAYILTANGLLTTFIGAGETVERKRKEREREREREKI